jgi:16S rRNA (uracil1498-N3)-methyltransferase
LVDGHGDSGVATFFVAERPEAGATLSLSESAERHAHVRRLREGDAVRVVDGVGTIGMGRYCATGRRAGHGEVNVDVTEWVDRPAELTLFVPVADRDRMLWLAEKACELAVTRWQPVMFARSRSVSPRGEGEAFARKVRARMISALEQSGGAWLPQVDAERSLEDAMATVGEAACYVLDVEGAPLSHMAPFGTTAIALGPEGGMEASEVDALHARGWRSASLGATTLRFETAGIAAAAIVRASQGR